MKAKFSIKKSVDRQFYFVLVAPNSEVIGTSEMYKRKAACLKGIESVRRNAKTNRYWALKSKDDKFYFVLKAKNNKTILTSEIYEKMTGLVNGTIAVQKHAPEAEVVEEFENRA